jgi:RNA polymerase sigma factor (sigma-70 family)
VSPWLSDLFLASQSDERLVSLARAGHDRAFVAIVERYRRQLIAFAGRLGPPGRAEDIVQQAFLSALGALQAGAEVDHLRGWLHQIVRHAAVKAATRAPSDSELHDTMAVADRLEDEVERRLEVRATLADVARLPERQRDALVMMAVQGRSRHEVAVSLGLTDGAVRQLVHRARASLRTAATAITPYPLAEWLAAPRAAPGADRIAEIALGTSSASAGAVVLKVGAIVVSGAVATGIGATPHRRHGPDAARHPSVLIVGGSKSHRSVDDTATAVVVAALVPAERLVTGRGASTKALGSSAAASSALGAKETGRGTDESDGSDVGGGDDHASGAAGTATGGQSGSSRQLPGSGGSGSDEGSSARQNAPSDNGAQTYTGGSSGADGGGSSTASQRSEGGGSSAAQSPSGGE